MLTRTVRAASKDGRFDFLDPSDHYLQDLLENTVLTLLKGAINMKFVGLTIGSMVSNQSDDIIYRELMRLLLEAHQVTFRTQIIKSLRDPLSADSLTFLCALVRDKDP